MGDIDFKVISATKNSSKFQKTRFWKEKSVEDNPIDSIIQLGHASEGHKNLLI